MDPQTAAIANLLGVLLVIVVVVSIIRFAVKKGVQDARDNRGFLPSHMPPSHQRVVPPVFAPDPPVVDGPGRFKISGVDRETSLDTTWYCDAQSAANAKVKGELQGIVVTQVDRTV